MSLDFTALIPCPAPSETSPATVVIGQNKTPEISEILSKFHTSLSAQAHKHTDTQAALVVTTSGSTGTPKQTLLTAAALGTSARATEDFLNLAGAQWLLALPVHYVAGAQVLARSVLAGTSPVITESVSRNTSFTAQDFLTSAEKLTAPTTALSLVPTQLHKLLESPQAVPALASFTAVLLGGAPAPTSLLERARQLGIAVHTTYGSAETAGGCIYSGTALPGVKLAIQQEADTPADSTQLGRIWLGGQHLASGYLHDPARTAQHFFTAPDGTPWYRTDDLGTFTDGKLAVAGRADDLIISGGIKLAPAPIAQKLEEYPGVSQAFVCGIPSQRWGQEVAAAIHLARGYTEEQVRAGLEPLIDQLEKAQRPKKLLFLTEFPLLSTGKPNRAVLRSLLTKS